MSQHAVTASSTVESLGLDTLLALPSLEGELGAVRAEIAAVMDSGDPHFDAALARSASSGGKMLRTALLLASAAASGGGDVARLRRAAAAVELLQLGSLIHDDIMDKAVVRRGVRTIYGVEGAEAALMAGDFLLARSGALAADVGGRAPELASRALGQVCDGQILEGADVGNLDRTLDGYLTSITGKTAALFACACQLGAHVAGLDDAASEALAAYGRHFGIAFQIADDILDLVGSAERLGKPVGTDLRSKVYTLPVLLALRSDAGPLLRQQLVAGELEAARRTVQRSGMLGRAVDEAFAQAARAAYAVATLDVVDGLEPLANFPAAYLRWALTALVADGEEPM